MPYTWLTWGKVVSQKEYQNFRLSTCSCQFFNGNFLLPSERVAVFLYYWNLWKINANILSYKQQKSRP